MAQARTPDPLSPQTLSFRPVEWLIPALWIEFCADPGVIFWVLASTQGILSDSVSELQTLTHPGLPRPLPQLRPEEEKEAEHGQGPGSQFLSTLLPTWLLGPGQRRLPSLLMMPLSLVSRLLSPRSRQLSLPLSSFLRRLKLWGWIPPSCLPQGPRELRRNAPSAPRVIAGWVSHSLPSPWLPSP